MLGFLAASMPTYRPLYRRLRHGDTGGTIPTANNTYDYRLGYSKNTVNITGGHGEVSHAGSGINVTNQVEMSIHPTHRDKWMRVSDGVEDDQNHLTSDYGHLDHLSSRMHNGYCTKNAG